MAASLIRHIAAFVASPASITYAAPAVLFTFRWPISGNVKTCYVKVGTGPTGGSANFDVFSGGTSGGGGTSVTGGSLVQLTTGTTEKETAGLTFAVTQGGLAVIELLNTPPNAVGVNLEFTIEIEETPRPVASGLTIGNTPTGNVVLSLTSTATNDDPIENVVQGRRTTTSATSQPLHTYTIPASTTVTVVGVVTVRRTGGTAGTAEDGAGYWVMFVAKNVSGTATIIGAQIIPIGQSQLYGGVILQESTNTIVVRFSGATDTNMTAHWTGRDYPVSS